MGEGSVDKLKDVADKRERCFGNEILKIEIIVTLERNTLMKQAKKSGIADSLALDSIDRGCSKNCRQQPNL